MFKNPGFLVGLTALILLAGCTQATPTPLPALNIFHLTLRAEPVEGTLTMRFIAEIAGGPDNARELNCIEGGWYFGEGGGNWSTIPECIPWTPDWKFPRHLKQTHTYSQPGTYHVNLTHGPLKASLVVEVP